MWAKEPLLARPWRCWPGRNPALGLQGTIPGFLGHYSQCNTTILTPQGRKRGGSEMG